MNKTIVGFLAAALFVPAAAFATMEPPFVTTEQKIEALKIQIAQLTQLLQQLLAQKSSIPSITTTCFVPTYDLYIGRDDSQTNGEVKKLQLWLKAEGYFPDAQGTGYYGEKTAAAVMKWQKAHGMDFVTLTSGVGKMTRAKMQEKCGTVQSSTKITWIIEKANPSAAPDSYQSSEQSISVDITNANGTKRYIVGKAFGCTDAKISKLWDGTPVLGQVSCYYAASGVAFTAYDRGGKIVIERFDEDASGITGGKKTVVLES